MPIKNPPHHQPSINLQSILRGIIVAFMMSIAGSLIFGVLLFLTGISESTLPVAASVILFVSVFCGGFFSSRHSGNRGLFHGIFVGIAIFLLIWIFTGLFISTGVAFLPLVQKLFICLIGGSLGGIIGVGF
ncbi:MAG: TIGR04086 family membrane protein [Bacillota bacterium]